MQVAHRTYIVRPGDTLAKIALREYGDPEGWKRIYNANRDRIKNPNVIADGWVLTIPGPPPPTAGPQQGRPFSGASHSGLARDFNRPPAPDRPKQRSEMTPQEQLDNPEQGASYPVELEVLELLIGVTALLRGLAKQGIKVFAKKAPKTTNVGKVDDVVTDAAGNKHYPNSPYKDKTRHPTEIRNEIDEQVKKDAREALGSNRVGRQNAEIERIHKKFIETGKWEAKNKEAGDGIGGWTAPSEEMIKARQAYLDALKAHKSP